MTNYAGPATLQLTDLAVAVQANLTSIVEAGGQPAWGGTFSGHDHPGLRMLLVAHEENDDVPLYLWVGDDMARVRVTEWHDRNGQMWDGLLLGNDDPPAALCP